MAEKFYITAELQIRGPANLAEAKRRITQGLKGVDIDVQIKGASQARKEIEGIRRATDATNDSVERLSKTVAISLKRFAAYSIVNRSIGLLTTGLSHAFDEAVSFEKSLVKVSQASGKSIRELTPLSEQITKLSTELGVTSSSLINVSTVLVQAGLSATETKIALATLAKTQLAPTFDDITQTAEGAIAVFNQFGKGASALEEQFGAINTVAAKFAVESGDLISAVRSVGGVFKSSGGSLNELLALFTSVRATTRESGESIATGLRTIFVRIQRPQTLKFLEEMGVKLTDLEGKFIGPYKAFQKLNAAFADFEQGDPRFIKVAEELAGFRQIGKVIPLLQQFKVTEDALAVATKGQTSLTEDAASAQQALAVRIVKVKEEFLAFVREIYNSPVFQQMADSTLKLLSALTRVGSTLKNVLPLLGVFATIKTVKTVGTFLGGVGRNLTAPRPFATGGPVNSASGDSFRVPGRKDDTLIHAQRGEFVITKKAASKMPKGALSYINKNGALPPAHQDGGYVGIKPKDNTVGVMILDDNYKSNSRVVSENHLFNDKDKTIGKLGTAVLKGSKYEFISPDPNLMKKGSLSKALTENVEAGLKNLVKDTASSIISQFSITPDVSLDNLNKNADLIFQDKAAKDMIPTIRGYMFEAVTSSITGATRGGGNASFDFDLDRSNQEQRNKLADFFGNDILKKLKLLEFKPNREYVKEAIPKSATYVAQRVKSITGHSLETENAAYPFDLSGPHYNLKGRTPDTKIFDENLVADPTKIVDNQATIIEKLSKRGFGPKDTNTILGRLKSGDAAGARALDEAFRKFKATPGDLDDLKKKILGFNKGGIVPGTGNRDSKLSMLTPGEGIITAEHTKRIGGVAAINAINNGGLPHFEKGGVFGNSAVQKSFQRHDRENDPIVNSKGEAQGVVNNFIDALKKFGVMFESIKSEKIRALNKKDAAQSDGLAYGPGDGIGIAYGRATRSTVRHETAHKMDGVIGSKATDYSSFLNSYASGQPGTFQNAITEKLKPILQKQLEKEGASLEEMEYRLKNEEIFADLMERTTPKARAILVYTTSAAKGLQRLAQLVNEEGDIPGLAGLGGANIAKLPKGKAFGKPSYYFSGGKVGDSGINTTGSIFKPRNQDTEPAMLAPGEWVVNRKGVGLLGTHNLGRANKGQKPVYLATGNKEAIRDSYNRNDFFATEGEPFEKLAKVVSDIVQRISKVNTSLADSLKKVRTVRVQDLSEERKAKKTNFGGSIADKIQSGKKIYGQASSSGEIVFGDAANTLVAKHETGHVVDRALGNGQLASRQPGTFQNLVATKLQRRYTGALKSAGYSDEKIASSKYRLSPEEIFADAFARVPQNIQEILVSTTDVSKGAKALAYALYAAAKEIPGLADLEGSDFLKLKSSPSVISPDSLKKAGHYSKGRGSVVDSNFSSGIDRDLFAQMHGGPKGPDTEPAYLAKGEIVLPAGTTQKRAGYFSTGTPAPTGIGGILAGVNPAIALGAIATFATTLSNVSDGFAKLIETITILSGTFYILRKISSGVGEREKTKLNARAEANKENLPGFIGPKTQASSLQAKSADYKKRKQKNSELSSRERIGHIFKKKNTKQYDEHMEGLASRNKKQDEYVGPDYNQKAAGSLNTERNAIPVITASEARKAQAANASAAGVQKQRIVNPSTDPNVISKTADENKVIARTKQVNKNAENAKIDQKKAVDKAISDSVDKARVSHGQARSDQDIADARNTIATNGQNDPNVQAANANVQKTSSQAASANRRKDKFTNRKNEAVDGVVKDANKNLGAVAKADKKRQKAIDLQVKELGDLNKVNKDVKVASLARAKAELELSRSLRRQAKLKKSVEQDRTDLASTEHLIASVKTRVETGKAKPTDAAFLQNLEADKARLSGKLSSTEKGLTGSDKRIAEKREELQSASKREADAIRAKSQVDSNYTQNDRASNGKELSEFNKSKNVLQKREAKLAELHARKAESEQRKKLDPSNAHNEDSLQQGISANIDVQSKKIERSKKLVESKKLALDTKLDPQAVIERKAAADQAKRLQQRESAGTQAKRNSFSGAVSTLALRGVVAAKKFDRDNRLFNIKGTEIDPDTGKITPTSRRRVGAIGSSIASGARATGGKISAIYNSEGARKAGKVANTLSYGSVLAAQGLSQVASFTAEKNQKGADLALEQYDYESFRAKSEKANKSKKLSGALAGAAQGALGGAALGSLAGPIGIAVGSALGGIIGGGLAVAGAPTKNAQTKETEDKIIDASYQKSSDVLSKFSANLLTASEATTELGKASSARAKAEVESLFATQQVKKEEFAISQESSFDSLGRYAGKIINFVVQMHLGILDQVFKAFTGINLIPKKNKSANTFVNNKKIEEGNISQVQTDAKKRIQEQSGALEAIFANEKISFADKYKASNEILANTKTNKESELSSATTKFGPNSPVVKEIEKGFDETLRVVQQKRNTLILQLELEKKMLSLRQESYKYTGQINKSLSALNVSEASFGKGSTIAANQALIQSSVTSQGSSKEASGAIDKNLEDLSKNLNIDKSSGLYQQLQKEAVLQKSVISTNDRILQNAQNIQVKEHGTPGEKKKDIISKATAGLGSSDYDNKIRDSIRDTVNGLSDNATLPEFQKAIQDATGKVGTEFLDNGTQTTQKTQELETKRYETSIRYINEISALEKSVNESRLNAINTIKEASDIKREFGGKAINTNTFLANRQNIANQDAGVTTRFSGKIDAQSSAATIAELKDKLLGATTKLGDSSIDGEQRAGLLDTISKTKDGFAQLTQSIRDTVDQRRKEIDIIKARNNVSNQGIEALISGDAKGFERSKQTNNLLSRSSSGFSGASRFAPEIKAAAIEALKAQKDAGAKVDQNGIDINAALIELVKVAIAPGRQYVTQSQIESFVGVNPLSQQKQEEVRSLADQLSQISQIQISEATILVDNIKGERNKSGQAIRSGFATGGVVPGIGNTDTVPAMLTPGEFVINKDSVKSLGLSNLFKLNGMKTGGFVGRVNRQQVNNYAKKNNIPGTIISQLDKNKLAIDSADSLIDIDPTLRVRQAKGYADNFSFDDIKGLYRKSENRILIKNTSGPEVLTHEIGHAFDDLNSASNNPGYINAYLKDVQNMTQEQKDRNKYFLQEGRSGLRESFAGTFDSVVRTRSGRADFPESSKFVSDFVGKFEAKTFSDTFKEIVAKRNVQNPDWKALVEFIRTTKDQVNSSLIKDDPRSQKFLAQLNQAEKLYAAKLNPVMRNTGGFIPGIGNTDKIPAMLTPGEFVINRKAASSIGMDRLNQLNNYQHFNTGGPVSPQQAASSVSRAANPSGSASVSFMSQQDVNHLTMFTNSTVRLSEAVEKLSSSSISITLAPATVTVNINASNMLKAMNSEVQDLINSEISKKFASFAKNLEKTKSPVLAAKGV